MTMQFRPEKNPHFRFNIFGRATIAGMTYRYEQRSGSGHFFRYADDSGRAQYFSDEELSRLSSMGRLKWEPNYYLPKDVKKHNQERHQALAELHGNVRDRHTKRLCWAHACIDMLAKGLLKRSDASYAANMDEIRGRAIKIGKDCRSGGGTPVSINIGEDPNPSTLRKWVAEYERDGASALVDGINRRRNFSRAIGPEMQALMGAALKKEFLNNKNYPIKQAYEDLKDLVDKRNSKNHAEGKRLLILPSLSSFNRFIKSLSPYSVTLQREGPDAARMKYRPIGQGLQHLTRPFQRIEIDEHTLDAMTIAEALSLNGMSEDDRKLLGLDGTKLRWTLTVAVCCTTKVIVAMKISRTPKADASLEALQMMLMDKGEWIDHLGGTGLWNMFGNPEMIVTDCGSALSSFAFRSACENLGIILMRCPAGVPECRGTIESLFHTVNFGLIPRLPGATFSNVVKKGGVDPADSAALNLDDLCFVLTRWLVDVYHNAPHGGLDNKTPLEAWNDAVDKYGVQVPPDMHAMRLVFGRALTRTLGRRGVRAFGVDYHSPALAAQMINKPDREVSIRWHPKDIGAILVHVGGNWIEVPAVLDGYEGVSAQTWLTAARNLRASRPRQTSFAHTAVLEAIRAITDRVGDAKLTQNILVEDWSAKRIQHAEDDLFTHFRVSNASVPGRTQNPNGTSIVGKAPSAIAARNPLVQDGQAEQRGPGPDEDDGEDWGFEGA